MVEIAPRVVIDPTVRFGKPVIRGTRVTVTSILAKLAGGMSMEELMQEYDLLPADIHAALHYAAERLADEEILVYK
jgi:uncharacterized protein (DUF433 family)